jgi:hypothetical protein
MAEKSSSKYTADKLSQRLVCIGNRWDIIGTSRACTNIALMSAKFLRLSGLTAKDFLNIVETALPDRIMEIRGTLRQKLNIDGDGETDTKPKAPARIPDLAKYGLIELAGQWDLLETQEISVKLATAYNIFTANGGSRENFITEAVNILSRRRGTIKFMVDTIIQQQMAATAAIPITKISSADQPLKQSEAPKIPEDTPMDIEEDMPGRHGKKPNPQQTLSHNYRTLHLTGRTAHTEKLNPAVAYENLRTQWDSISFIERGRLIKTLYNHECRQATDKNKALERICSELSFLDIETVTGYIVICSIRFEGNTDNSKLFSQYLVRAIGEMKIEFGDLLNPQRFYGVICEAAKDRKNLTPQGSLRANAIRDIHNGLKSSSELKNGFRQGVKYAIDPSFRPISRYKGIAGEELEFIPETDPAYTEWKRRLDPRKGKSLFKGRGYYFIDNEAVCEASQIDRSDTDSYAFEDEEEEDEEERKAI